MAQLKDDEQQHVQKAAVLLVAGMVYGHIVSSVGLRTSNGDQWAGPGQTVHLNSTDAMEVDPKAATLAFDAAEAFVAEADRRGISPASIVSGSFGGGLD